VITTIFRTKLVLRIVLRRNPYFICPEISAIIIWPIASERSDWSNEITWPDVVKKVVGR